MKFVRNDTCLRCFLLYFFLIFLSPVAEAQLKADFTADKEGGCSPLLVFFKSQTAGASANAVYHWDFDNGNISAFADAGAIFKEDRVYNITLTVIDGTDTSTITRQVTVLSPPAVDFKVSVDKGCAPLAVSFTPDAAGANITGYTWDFGDGNIQQSDGAPLSHTYTVSQKATVSLTVSNQYGCTKTVIHADKVNVLGALQANFSPDKTTLCRIADPVKFNNTSIGTGALSYAWDFGDGGSSTLAAPSHVFGKKGTYAIALTVKNNEGCTATTAQDGLINVANFSADFTQPSSICKDAPVSFVNASSPTPSGFEWGLDGGPLSNANEETFTYTFATAGAHNLRLRATFGDCVDTITKKIVVTAPPDLQGFIATTTGKCGTPLTYHFEDTTAGAKKWEWDFSYLFHEEVESNLQAPSHTYNTDGDYQAWLRVTNAAGCTAVTTKYIGASGPFIQILSDGEEVSCAPVTRRFRATSTDSIVNYTWNFGDEATSSLVNPVHVYTSAGEFHVTLTYKTISGCTGTVSYGSVGVYKKPHADFTVSETSVCGNSLVKFAATQQGANMFYYWDVGDNGTIYSYQNNEFTHQYSHDTSFDVELIVTNNLHCSDTMIRKNYIKVHPPFAHIGTTSNTCDGTRGEVSFTQESFKGLQYTWDFGDGSTLTTDSTQKTVKHTYAKSGQYPIKITAINGPCSVSDSSFTQVLLKQSPVLSGDKTDICASDTLNVHITNYDRNPLLDLVTPNYSMSYFYRDNTPFNGLVQTDSYYYLWSNEFLGNLSRFDKAKKDIRVVTTSVGFGCLDTSNFIPLISRGSEAGFRLLDNTVCFKTNAMFQDTSVTNSKIISWQWDFGDGNKETLAHGGTTGHAYTTPGTYNAFLTVIDSSGCSSNSSTQVQPVVASGPAAAFDISGDRFIGLPISFNNTTNNYNSDQTVYNWSFGDGAVSSDMSPVHNYDRAGQYQVKLVAKNPGSGCADTVTQTIVIGNFNSQFSIRESFITDLHCPPVMVQFTNNSVNYQRVKWDFGDGVVAGNLNNPAHVYEKPGKYVITLFVYGPGGLAGKYIDSVIIEEPVAALRADNKAGCVGLFSTLSVASTNASILTWDAGDGSIAGGNDIELMHQYNSAGVYKPAIIVADSNGCRVLVKLDDSIVVKPNPVIKVLPADATICRGAQIQLTASGGSSYTWSPAAGLSNSQIDAPIASPDTSSSYELTVKDDIGCFSTTTIKVTVVQKQQLTLTGNTAICAGNSSQLQASGTDTYQWTAADNSLSSTTISNPIARPANTTNYTVLGTDNDHCFTDTANITIQVAASPSVAIANVPEVLAGTTVQLTGNYSSDVVQWAWTPPDFLSCNNCPNPISKPGAPITYQLTVKNSSGCEASATVSIKLQCAENRVYIPTAFSPNNDGINDVFTINGISQVKHLIIYSRWGKPVYERSNLSTADRSGSWDGRFKGELLPSGAYTYYAEMECPAGGGFVKTGTVLLIH